MSDESLPEQGGHPGEDGSSTDSPRPTMVRHAIVAVATLMSVLLYLDRFCVSFAERYIKEDLGLTDAQMGVFLSAFFLTYALAQVPSGWLSDRFGARLMMTTFILVWSLFTGLIGAVYGFALLLVMRAGCGLGQSGAYPTSGSLLSKWIPFTNRGTASSFVAVGGRLGGAIAPLLTGMLMVLFVPVSMSSSFDADDLLDPVGLSVVVTETHQQAAAEPAAETEAEAPVPVAGDEEKQARQDVIVKLYEYLPDSAKRAMDEISTAQAKLDREHQQKLQQELEARLAAGEPTGTADKDQAEEKEEPGPRFEPTDAQLADLLKGLNEVLSRQGFYEGGLPSPLKLPQQATTLIKEEASSTLDEAGVTRLNRLVLEVALPDYLGKIYVAGWRPVMFVYGAMGILVAGLFWFVCRDRPEKHPWANEAERSMIENSRPAGSLSPHGKPGMVPVGRLLKSGSMWCNCIGQVGTNIGWVFLVTWFPRYLAEVHHVPIIDRALMASVPLMCGLAGTLIGGRVTDILVPRLGLKWGRRLPWSMTRFIAMTAFLISLTLDSPWAVTAAMAMVAMGTDMGIPCAWAFCQDVGGRHVGSVLGWGNMFGNLGATVSPILLNWVIEGYGWNSMFLTCAAAFLVSGVMSLGIDATKPIALPEDDDEPAAVSDEPHA
ncbi:MAG: MFS transporter [Planctomycetaceae bacterium]|nr:MFS transporter [Planctomycetaceae bacterium]